ncbi:hypothetical protein LUTEI9C_60021 [Luteimonas sp. 9C]|nr:hypothetical protein LUTEI9C_60021 [Luteimonas sp. 9C]
MRTSAPPGAVRYSMPSSSSPRASTVGASSSVSCVALSATGPSSVACPVPHDPSLLQAHRVARGACGFPIVENDKGPDGPLVRYHWMSAPKRSSCFGKAQILRVDAPGGASFSLR